MNYDLKNEKEAMQRIYQCQRKGIRDYVFFINDLAQAYQKQEEIKLRIDGWPQDVVGKIRDLQIYTGSETEQMTLYLEEQDGKFSRWRYEYRPTLVEANSLLIGTKVMKYYLWFSLGGKALVTFIVPQANK